MAVSFLAPTGFLCLFAIQKIARSRDKFWVEHFFTKFGAICVWRVCKRGPDTILEVVWQSQCGFAKLSPTALV